MNRKFAVLLTGAVLIALSAAPGRAQTAGSKNSAQESSIWEDDSSGDSRFFTRKQGRTAADIQREKAKFAPKPKTATKFVYTGPSKEDIAKQAPVTAQQNFRKLLPPEFDYRFEKVEYNVDTDSFKVTKLNVLPKSEQLQKKGVYIMNVGSVELYKFNIGERGGTAQNQTGTAVLSEIDVPVFNAKNIKVGKMEIGSIKASGNFPELLKSGTGLLDRVSVSKLRSEKIIPRTILDNIVRSKIFSLDQAEFTGLNIPSGFLGKLKDQSIQGFSFSSATINGDRVVGTAGAEAALISYSSRFLDPDLVVGARMEKQKDKPIANMEAVKRNVTAHKQAVKEFNGENASGNASAQSASSGKTAAAGTRR